MHRSLPKTFTVPSCARAGLLLLAVLGLSACVSVPFAPGPSATAPSPQPQLAADSSAGLGPIPGVPPDAGYGLEPGDVVRISVWREEALDQGVLVRPDGGISFPLAGELQAEGKTIAELTHEITERLTPYIDNPVVTVSLQQNDGNRIYVTGRVNQPGVFLLNRPVNVMQALSMAGGLTPFADKDGITILRRQGDRQVTIPFDYKQVRKGQDLQQNIVLQAGDTLIVP
jgi:polysaccharide export outer membrane protein